MAWKHRTWMVWLGIVGLTTLSLAGLCRPVVKQDPTSGTPKSGVAAGASAANVEANLKTLGLVVKTIDEHFYDRNFQGVDWPQLKAEYRRRIVGAQSDAEVETLINAMLGQLHASHTEFFTTDDVEYYMLRAVSEQNLRDFATAQIGVMGRREPEGYRVSAVLNDGPAAKAGILSGDLLISADDAPYSATSLRGKEGTTVQIALRRVGDAATRTVSVVPVKANPLRAFLDATLSSARVIQVKGKRIGYLHLWTMGVDRFREALNELVLHKLHDTDGLILDLRDGYGGLPFGFSDVFFRPDLAWTSQGHDGRTSTEPTGYNRPMVVLINGGTRSAKEFLADQLKLAHRATLVGTRTAGAFLGARFFPIGRHALLELAVEKLQVNGMTLEGRGVDPDIVVAVSGAGQDAPLLRAEQLLSGRGREAVSRGTISVVAH
jgi:carboxyl-terminal processing protease